MVRARVGGTCGGGRVAFAQPLRQLGHLAANGLVTTHQAVFRDGVVVRSAEGPVVVLLEVKVGQTKVRVHVGQNICKTEGIKEKATQLGAGST